MNKIPRISGNTMIKYLIKKKFLIISRKGSHVTLRQNNFFTTVPAGNKILKIGLQLQILTDVSIDRNEFKKDYNDGIVK